MSKATDTQLLHGLGRLRELADSAAAANPVDQLLQVGKTFQGGLDIAKRKTPDTVSVRVADLNVSPDYQRPPDREKVQRLVEHLRAGSGLPPINVNQRPDGTLWITDGQHRAMAHAALGHARVDAIVSALPSQEEPARTNIMAKVAPGDDMAVAARLLGCGARIRGKRLVLTLGDHGTVTYLPHSQEFVAKTERGALQIDGADARGVTEALRLQEFLQTG